MIMEELKKVCSKCRAEKRLMEFCKNKNTKDGLNAHCRECVKNYKKNYRQSEQGKKVVNDYNREYIKEKRTDEEFRKKENTQTQKYYYKNKKKINEVKNKRQKTRRMEDLVFKMRHHATVSINHVLKKYNIKKIDSIWKYLPYTPQQLKEHLESLWEPWMNWENYGMISKNKKTWNIDHIFPQSLLPFDSFEHPNFLKCWCLENLRPLDAKENLKKRNKLLYNEQNEQKN